MFELPDGEITEKEHQSLINRIRGRVLNKVSLLDFKLTQIITDFFLRDIEYSALWAKTVFDEDKIAFGAKIIWLGRIMSSHPEYQKHFDEKTRAEIHKRLDEIRVIRNDFAHSHTKLDQFDSNDIKNKIIVLYDFEGGTTVPREFKMIDMVNIINDSWLFDHLDKIISVTEEIRKN